MAPLRSWSLAGLAVLCGGFFLLFASNLLGDAYARLSAEQRNQGLSNLAAISAARHAVRLQPWRSSFRSDLAWTFGVRGDVRSMRAAYHDALRWAPASAYLWLEYAQALARSRRFDAEYTLALTQAVRLAPNARPVQLSGARMGSVHWNHGGDEDRRIWAANLTYALRSSPQELLAWVLRRRKENSFCGFVGAELGLDRWCIAISAARRICDTLKPGAKGVAADQCARHGLWVAADDSDSATAR